QVAVATASVVARIGEKVRVGIHTHNDAECGVANALAAVEAGARHVQGTVNGYGERTGNANLISILPNLQLKLGYECVPGDRIARLTETAHLIDEICNVQPDPNQPYVGINAFSHKGGMHVAGMLEDARTFEHIDPEIVGNGRKMLISELSGKGTVQARAADAGLELDPKMAAKIVNVVKQRESEGYHYEAADASFDLLIRKQSGDYEPLFKLESWRVIAEFGADGRLRTEATIKIWVGEDRLMRTAEGNGPVNALDKALRDAIGEIHPHLKDIDLVNYKVRILNETKGTGAVTRVLIDASDGRETWGAIGVSENIIEASWEALVDALEYGMQPGRDGHARAAAGRPANENVGS
ncbi:MAG: citramalate synthase, partial [Thermoleophilia bacterium]|nr:citramalate synthase [Thermoleophilia bacterium]